MFRKKRERRQKDSCDGHMDHTLSWFSKVHSNLWTAIFQNCCYSKKANLGTGIKQIDQNGKQKHYWISEGDSQSSKSISKKGRVSLGTNFAEFKLTLGLKHGNNKYSRAHNRWWLMWQKLWVFDINPILKRLGEKKRLHIDLNLLLENWAVKGWLNARNRTQV